MLNCDLHPNYVNFVTFSSCWDKDRVKKLKIKMDTKDISDDNRKKLIKEGFNQLVFFFLSHSDSDLGTIGPCSKHRKEQVRSCCSSTNSWIYESVNSREEQVSSVDFSIEWGIGTAVMHTLLKVNDNSDAVVDSDTEDLVV